MKDAAAVLAILVGLVAGFLAFSVVAFGLWATFGHPPPGAHPGPAGMGPIVCGGACVLADLALVIAGVAYWIRKRRAP